MNTKVLGVDFGLKRIGLAIGDFDISIASKFGVVLNKSDDYLIQEFGKIFNEWGIKMVIFGLPLNMSNKHKENLVTKSLDKFVELLKNNFSDIKLNFMDERLSTFEAGEIIEKNGFTHNDNKDSLAAQIILQRWFDLNKI